MEKFLMCASASHLVDAEDVKDTVETSSDTSRDNYANINAFISVSFGEVEMDHHDSVFKALGSSSIAAAESIDASITGDAIRTTVDNTITYTSSTFKNTPEGDVAKSVGAQYTASALGDYQSMIAKTYTAVIPFKTVAHSLKVNKVGFSVPYSTVKPNDTVTNTVGSTDDSKTTSFGAGYANKKWNLGDSIAITYKVNTNDMNIGYGVVNDLTVFGEHYSSGDATALYLGANISF